MQAPELLAFQKRRCLVQSRESHVLTPIIESRKQYFLQSVYWYQDVMRQLTIPFEEKVMNHISVALAAT